MRFQNLIIILIISIILTGCFGDDSTTTTNSNKNKPEVSNSTPLENTNVKPEEKTDEIGVTKTPPPQKINDAETLKSVVIAYCNAIKSKNDAELQKVYSKQAWATVQKYASDEGFKSVSKFLDDAEPVGNKCSAINEQISGNTAVAIIATETYPNGVPLKFVKEGNEWKMTTESTDY